LEYLKVIPFPVCSVYYPDFDGRIGIPTELRDEVIKEISQSGHLEGIEFILVD